MSARDDVHYEDLVRVKDVVVIHVADRAHGVADDLNVIQLCARRDLPADDDDVAFRVGFTGNPALLIDCETGIEDRIGDGVANFIRVTFTDGFGGKNEAAEHVKKRCESGELGVKGEEHHG